MKLTEIPVDGIPYDHLRIKKIPVTPAYAPRDQELLAASSRALVVNPDRICMPIGAMWAVLGVHRAIPFVQGAQGCTTYARYTFSRIFKEPATIATASFHEDAAVFGGRRNLVEGLRNLVVRYWPEVIGVVTTCSSEIMGDDIGAFIKEAREKLQAEIGPEKMAQITIVPVNTPSFAGSHVEGYDRAAKAFVQTLATRRDAPSNRVNIIPGLFYPGDIREIKHILREMGIESTILFDISDTLDAPLEPPQSIPYYPPGGTDVAEIKEMANAAASFALQPDAGGSGARFLERKFAIPAVVGPVPVGIAATDTLLQNLSNATGCSISPALRAERGRLVDAMADTFHHTMMKRVAVFGDPDYVAGITQFACELGMTPVAVSAGTESKSFAATVEATLSQYGHLFLDQPKVFNGGDLFEFEEYLKTLPRLDLIIGNSKGVDIARELEVPIVRAGFPIYDRFGYQKRPIVGYRGAELLLYEIANAVLDYRYPDDRTQQL
ncbi:MAG: nitrogenase component 1 [Bacillota bacterium]